MYIFTKRFLRKCVSHSRNSAFFSLDSDDILPQEKCKNLRPKQKLKQHLKGKYQSNSNLLQTHVANLCNTLILTYQVIYTVCWISITYIIIPNIMGLIFQKTRVKKHIFKLTANPDPILTGKFWDGLETQNTGDAKTVIMSRWAREMLNGG